MAENYYEWTEFYEAFADKLLEYKDNRKELCEKIIEAFNTPDLKLPKLAKEGYPEDIDPFTVFAIFNRRLDEKEITKSKIIQRFIDVFDMDYDTPKNFDGIPIQIALHLNFVSFNDSDEIRKENIQNLWNFFETAIKYSKEKSPELKEKFIKQFDQVIKQNGVKWNITMGLFWIRPNSYINLDGPNRTYIDKLDYFSEEDKAFFKKAPNGKEYLEFNDKILNYLIRENEGPKYFPKLSNKAWDFKHQEDYKVSFLKWFDPIINTLKDNNGKILKSKFKDLILENDSAKEPNNEYTFALDYLIKADYIEESEDHYKLTQKGWDCEMNISLANQIYKEVNEREEKEPIINALGDADVKEVHTWTYSPGEHSEKWEDFYNDGIMALGFDEYKDLKSFPTKEDLREDYKTIKKEDSSFDNDVLALWEFSNEVKPGDIIFAKKGFNEILGKGIVQSDYLYNEENDKYPHIRKVNWEKKGSWITKEKVAPKTLTDVTNISGFPEMLNETIGDSIRIKQEYPPYSKEDFLEEVYIDENGYNKLVSLLHRKKNIILQGAPGVGKTFLAKRLAYSILGEKNRSQVEMIQFHQSYSYEDFIMGYRPTAQHYDLVPGSFYSFCKKAQKDDDHDYFFIIDEINRGNLSKIFGELFMLLENDKRGSKNRLKLLYSDETFYIPENVYIIGMMNTADRSLALLDFALRRRFGFFELKPGFDSQGFRNYMKDLDSDKFNSLISEVKHLNHEISQDETLGEEFSIGHSFFSNLSKEDLEDEKRLNEIIEFELIPLLKEYWFDEPEKVKQWSQNLKRAIR